MKEIKRTAALLFILLLFYPLGAQQANFSGTWALNREKTQLSELPEIIIDISQDKGIINYLRTVKESRNEWVTQMSFSTDGKEGTYTDSRGNQLKCSCAFREGKLVISYQSRQRRSGKWVILDIEEEHSLSADGKTLSIAHSEKWGNRGGKWPRPMVFDKLTPDAEAVQNKKNLFLGQQPPGNIPEVFAPGIVSIKNGKEYKPAISPDGKEIFFIRRTPGLRNDRLWYSRVEKGKLSTSQLAPFAYDCLEGQPCFTPDGKRLFFMSRRPLPDTTETSSVFRLWMVRKVKEGWGIPQYSPSVIDDHRPAQMSITQEGTIYFVSNKERKIFYSQLEDGSYKSADKLDNKVNDLPLVGHPAIAPDGSYIIVDLVYRKEGQLISDFLISFKNPDGSWRNPQSMKKVLQITTQVYAAPYLSPDGKYLFFEEYIPQTDQSDILWVSTRIIDALKPDDLE